MEMFCKSEGLPWLEVLVPIIAKMCIASAFTVIYMYAGELFPTVIRGFAIGIASTTSQIGLVVTPYILYLVSAAEKKSMEGTVNLIISRVILNSR